MSRRAFRDRLIVAFAVAGLIESARVFAIPISDAKLIAGVKREVVRDLKDPDSVRFRDVRVFHDRDSPVVCGELNAKNGYGAYVGFRPFYGHLKYTDSTKDFTGNAQGMGDDIQQKVFSQMWARFCGGR